MLYKTKLVRLLSKRSFVYGLAVVACLTGGIIQTAATYDVALGMGDNSTFYAFARNIANGEVMYKDFIHFRTPGTVTIFGWLMEVMGQSQSTTEITTRIETLILYPLLFLVAAMVFFRKRNPWYVFIAFAGMAFMPGVSQLRSAFGLLAVVVYGLSFESSKRRKLYLLASGFLAAVTFFFGQEIFLMVMACMAAGELYHLGANKWKLDSRTLLRVKYLAIGLAAGLVPLLLYMALFSSISNFLYYTLYYSFVLQPKFMNLPFPNFGFTNLVYYLPFIMYWLCFVVLYTNKKLGVKESLLLSFGILRLISATGRADFGHLIFSIPEVFVIVPFMVAQARFSQLTWQNLKRFAPFGVVVALLMYLSTKEGAVLVLVPFVVLAAVLWRDAVVVKLKAKVAGKTGSFASHNLYAILASLFVIFVYIFTPTYISVARAVKIELTVDDSQSRRIGGVKTDEINYQQIQSVRKAAEPFHPKTVFAFPIQPFYYSLGQKHASRFLTFEPQTTIKEQDETIQDLQRTKPEVIVFDPLQAHGLSGSLWKISDYITSNYRVAHEVNMRESLWVMVPKAQPAREDKLVFRLFHDNTGKDIKSQVTPIQTSSMGLYNAIAQKTKQLSFVIDTPRPASLELSVHDSTGAQPAEPVCGIVGVLYHGHPRVDTRVCSNQGKVNVPLEQSNRSITIVLENPSPNTIIWNDATIRDVQ